MRTGGTASETGRDVTTLQPTAGHNDGTDDGSATKGKDVFSWQGCGSGIANWGAIWEANVMCSSCNTCTGSAYLQFSLAGMPTQNIVSAQLQVYMVIAHWTSCGWPWSADPIFAVRRVTGDWNEMTLDWNLQPAYDPAIIASRTVTGVAWAGPLDLQFWMNLDITDLYRAWASGTPNYGVRLSHENAVCMNCDTAYIITSDDGLTQLTYTGAAGGDTGSPAGVSAILADVAAGPVAGK